VLGSIDCNKILLTFVLLRILSVQADKLPLVHPTIPPDINIAFFLRNAGPLHEMADRREYKPYSADHARAIWFWGLDNRRSFNLYFREVRIYFAALIVKMERLRQPESNYDSLSEVEKLFVAAVNEATFHPTKFERREKAIAAWTKQGVVIPKPSTGFSKSYGKKLRACYTQLWRLKADMHANSMALPPEILVVETLLLYSVTRWRTHQDNAYEELKDEGHGMSPQGGLDKKRGPKETSPMQHPPIPDTVALHCSLGMSNSNLDALLHPIEGTVWIRALEEKDCTRDFLENGLTKAFWHGEKQAMEKEELQSLTNALTSEWFKSMGKLKNLVKGLGPQTEEAML
jgi:hypothetical protein